MKNRVKMQKSRVLAAALAVLLALMMVLTFKFVPAAAESGADFATANWIEAQHTDFVESNLDRSSFMPDSYDYQSGTGEKKGEQLAAEYIISKLEEFGYSFAASQDEDTDDEDDITELVSFAATSINDTDEDDTDNDDDTDIIDESTSSQIIFQTFSEKFSVDGGSFWTQSEVETRWSQNVIVRFDNPATTNRLIVGGNIDNNYSATNHGALSSASSVAILLYLCHTLIGQDLPYDLDIVFFGAGGYGGTPYFIGADHYMEQNNFGKILLFANVGRIGGDTTYVYSDEVKTRLADYVAVGGIKQLPIKNLPILKSGELGGPDDMPYSHYGLSGNHARFKERGITSISLFCGEYNGVTLVDREGSGDILGKDTVENMLAAYPLAYKKMTGAADRLSALIFDENLGQLIKSSNSDKFDYSVLLKSWIAYLIFAALAVITFVVLMFVSRSLIRKYPLAQQTTDKPKKVDPFDGF